MPYTFIRYERSSISDVHRVLNFELVQRKCLLLIPEFYCANRTSKFTGSYFKIRITYGHKMKANLRLRPLSNARATNHSRIQYMFVPTTIKSVGGVTQRSIGCRLYCQFLSIVLPVFCSCKAMDKEQRTKFDWERDSTLV